MAFLVGFTGGFTGALSTEAFIRSERLIPLRSNSGGVLCLSEPRVFGDCLGLSERLGRLHWLEESWLVSSGTSARSNSGGVLGPMGLLLKFEADYRESFTGSGF